MGDMHVWNRYLGIRKHLQQLWEKQKPRYLKKSSCLQIKGDVNAIGRVHVYMETIGVINTGHNHQPEGLSLFLQQRLWLRPVSVRVCMCAWCTLPGALS
jgi:hypothetical protein